MHKLTDEQKELCKHNAKQLLIAIDQLGNALLGSIASLLVILHIKEDSEKYWADETISSHCYRWDVFMKCYHLPRKIVDYVALHLFHDENHCEESYLSEKLGRQEPPECRK